MADAIFILPDDLEASFAVEEEDPYGNPVPMAAGSAPPTVATSDPLILDAKIDADGHLSIRSPAGKLGTAQVTVTISGTGGTPLSAIQNVEVVAGVAAKIGLKPLGLTPKAAPVPPAPAAPPA